MSRPVTILLNVLAFNLCWTITIIGVGQPWWWVGPLLILCSAATQSSFSPRPKREITLLLLGAAVGTALDALGMTLGMFQFAGGPIEFAIVFAALWANFGTTVRPSLAWLWNRPVLAACLGAVAAPLNYGIAARFGAIEFMTPTWHGVLWVAVQYALILPAWVLAAPRLLSEPAGRVPQPTAPSRTPGTGTPEP